jgi:AcrR family transcriptional regulator
VATRKRLTRQESKAKTRAELLRAAARLFVRKGFVDTSLSDIAEEAALTKGAVYSNFENKEDLFLALLQERAGGDDGVARDDELAPSDLSVATGDSPEERAAAWGRAVAAIRPRRRNVALFMELNAVAMRSDRARAWVAGHNSAFFRSLGAELAQVLDAPDEDPEVLGLIAQSLYAGLLMHTAFTGPLDDDVYERAYRMLATFVRRPADA